MTDWKIPQEQFNNMLMRSHTGAWIVARWLWALGQDVMLPGFTGNEADGYDPAKSDSGDLFLSHQGAWKRVEVKWLTMDFKGRTDWPKDYVIFEGEAQYHRKHPKPDIYILLSADALTCAIIEVEHTQPHWETQLIAFDSKQPDKKKPCLTLPPTRCWFTPMGEVMKQGLVDREGQNKVWLDWLD